MTNWFYSKGRERSTAITLEQLQQLVAGNEVGPDDLVWTTGMEKWEPAKSIPALKFSDQYTLPPVVETVSAMASPVAMPAPAPMVAGSGAASAIAYYNMAGGMPARAAEMLVRQAAPTGDVGDWPLDDEHVRQFDDALKLRSDISAAANLYLCCCCWSSSPA